MDDRRLQIVTANSRCIQLKSRTLFVRDSAAGEVTVRSCVTHNALLSSSHHHHLCCIIICNRIRVWRTKRRSEKENCDFVQEYNMRAGRYTQPSWPNGQNYDATADDNDEQKKKKEEAAPALKNLPRSSDIDIERILQSAVRGTTRNAPMES